MIISKSGKFKMLRCLGVFCAMMMGFITLVGCSVEDAADTLGIDTDFDETESLDLDTVTVTENFNTLSILAAGDPNCGSTSIQQAIDEADIDGLDDVDIDSINFAGMSGTYTADWTPDTVTFFTCSVTISGSQDTITIAETAIDGMEGDLENLTTPEEEAVLNYYIDNRDEVFNYCVTCDDVEIDTYTVTYDVNVAVRIKGSIL
jgi:hypothetical protein